MSVSSWSLIGWIIKAGIVGFIVSAVFAGEMKLTRNRFLIPYLSVVAVFLFAFVLFNKIDIVSLLTQNWVWGILAGGLTSVVLVRHVRSQPASREAHGSDIQLPPHYQAGFRSG